MVSRIEKNKKERKKIEKEDKIKKNKERAIKIAKHLFIAISILSVIVLYIYYASTRQLIVKEYSPTFEELPENFNGFKIVQFGDLYYDNNYDYIIDKLVLKINEIEPDLVLFTGGLVNRSYKVDSNKIETLTNKLKKINSNTSKYYVVSNKDNELAVEILNESGFIFLDDKEEKVFFNDTTPISIIGINKETKISYSDDLFNILILNDSKKIDSIIENVNAEIVFSGGNLNGQIRIPYYGALFNRGKYIDSHYKKDNTEIYVTSGIGTDNLPIRLFNHPSINFLRIRVKK